jgi:hypothetical protein
MNDTYTITDEDESNEPDNSDHFDDRKSDVLCKTGKKPSNEHFHRSAGLNVIIHNPESVTEVVSAIIQLFTEQSNMYQSQNAQQWKVFSDFLKWSDVTPKEVKKFFGTGNYGGTSQKGQRKRLLVN